jgi:hypothetical protein
MRPAFRRGWEGEGKLNRRPGAGQRARSDRHTGAAILLWETRGQSPWRSHQSGNGGGSLPQPQRCTNNGTLARCDAAGWCARATVRQRPSGKERGKSASESAQRSRTLRSAKRGKECVLKPSRSSALLPIVTRKGRDYRLGSRKRIERVAVRQPKHPCSNLTLLAYLTT